METLEAARSSDDKRRWEIAGHGSFLIAGAFGRKSSFEAGGQTWTAASDGLLSRSLTLTDAVGGTVGSYSVRGMAGRKGTLELAGRTLDWAPDGRTSYALSDSGQVVARFTGRLQRRSAITIEADPDLDDVMLLVGAWIARTALNARQGALMGAAGAAGG